MFLLTSHNPDDMHRCLDIATSRFGTGGRLAWDNLSGLAVISQNRVNCVTSGDCCAVLDQLYASDGLSANGSCHEGLFSSLLQRWRSKGTAFLADLNGSWALVLHDPDKEEVLVSTDRFSTYPLWQCNLDGGGMAISSDFTVLTGLVHGTIDYGSLWSFLTRGRPVGQHSFYNEIRAIRPATALLFRNGKLVEETEWYEPRFDPEYGRPLSYWGRELAERLEAAVRDQMTGSETPGLLLSGGLDSRLVASVSPKNTTCFTLADFNNREMKIASAVARTCRLRHCPIIRDENWYPNMLEEAARKSIGLWHWHNMHFLPLDSMDGDWAGIDRVMLGMGFDTFLKGNQIAEPALWRESPDALSEPAVSFLADFGARRLPVEQFYEQIMEPDALQACRKAYKTAIEEETRRALPTATCMADAWEMVQFRSIHRVPYFTNLTCLREFIPTRNVIFDNRLYDLYFRIPAAVRRTGNIVRAAHRQRDVRLSLMLDGNSWLPVLLPSSVHDWARRARRGISAVRSRWYRMTGSKEYKSYGSWPQVGRLWIRNGHMREFIEESLGSCMDAIGFRLSRTQAMWEDYKRGDIYCPSVMDAMAGLLTFTKRLGDTRPASSSVSPG